MKIPVAYEKAVHALKAKLFLTDSHKISLISWYFATCNPPRYEVSWQVAIFTTPNKCVQGEGPTFKEALLKCQAQLPKV